MSQRMLFNGTTWAISESDLPDYLSRTIEQPGSLRRSFLGTARRYTRFDKWTLPASWSMVGTTVRDYVSAMAQLDGTVTWEREDGTYITRAEPGSYSEQEVSYLTYDIGITLKEV